MKQGWSSCKISHLFVKRGRLQNNGWLQRLDCHDKNWGGGKEASKANAPHLTRSYLSRTNAQRTQNTTLNRASCRWEDSCTLDIKFQETQWIEIHVNAHKCLFIMWFFQHKSSSCQQGLSTRLANTGCPHCLQKIGMLYPLLKKDQATDQLPK